MKKIVEKFKNNILYLIGAMMFAISGATLSIQLILNNQYNTLNMSIVGIVSFICCIWIWKKTLKENICYIKNNLGFTLICIVLAIGVIGELLLYRRTEIKGVLDNFIINPFRIRYTIIASFSAMYFGVYIGNKIKTWLLDFYKSLNGWEKKAYIIVSIITFVVIIISYSYNKIWYTQQDLIYSIDSGRCWSESILKPSFYEIRHPIISIFIYPVYAIVNLAVDVVIPTSIANVAKAIIMQVINAQLLILIGLQIEKLTKNKMVFILYVLSFSTLLYFILFEKYQMCTFLLVLYVFTICTKREKSTASLISAAGVMPTSCVMGIAEILTPDSFIKKVKKIGKIVIITLLTLVCLGRTNAITNGLHDMKAYADNYSNKDYTMEQKIIATTKMVQNSIVALPSALITKQVFGQEVERYWWIGLEDDISFLALAIIAVAIIGAIKNRKKLFVKLATIWFSFGFVLLCILNWTPDEAPLFSLYFSWAIIPLFVLGMDFLLKKFKINTKVAYTVFILYITVINMATLTDIAKYLLQ